MFNTLCVQLVRIGDGLSEEERQRVLCSCLHYCMQVLRGCVGSWVCVGVCVSVVVVVIIIIIIIFFIIIVIIIVIIIIIIIIIIITTIITTTTTTITHSPSGGC